MSRFPNRRWLVIPASEVTNVDFNQVLESSADSLRYSVDQSKTFVKYEVNIIEETYTQTIINPETMKKKLSPLRQVLMDDLVFIMEFIRSITMKRF